MTTAEQAFQDNKAALLSFMQCPECEGDGYLHIDTDREFDDGERNVTISAECLECGHSTGPVPIARSAAALHDRV